MICYVDDCCIMVKPEHLHNIKNKLCKDFGIFKDGKLSKLLGVQYKWKIFDPE